MALLREHRAELLRLLEVEWQVREHPAVRDALEVFHGARLVAVRAGGKGWRA
ncbi:MAG: hypothetical protein HYZ29_23440 [Myxococcales bacterium]|nr:hypothetical protein [Myxococcales bacterium]